ncbi:CCAAT/enhancer-binding protein zeta, putative [Entamoeba invadens IP1]|uniref:CCAAT/enhancer-binding protein zeta, putative n=1 Tax=Entamoeba invadens IP1 TaxID=370355 RepID=A0A0A1TWR1_ENTIV|nr:CCAAT/enhancer-binding protein zeta, putative [Entamoeba invadens IP1]ELP85621.1 CCAAT/enhancer-binding protein zeta, putative [Entamoeba invadens IP1]|eukprot:XP_004184967.1 CCAAT/enhancer-binding protein zeta, putative [Entamoeba invadens IP1]
MSDTDYTDHWWKGISFTPVKVKNDMSLAQKKHEIAKNKYDQLVLESEKEAVNSKDGKWMRNLVNTGTYSDQVKALALLVRSNPLTCLEYLVQLLAICEKKNKDVSDLAIRASKELFIDILLPDEPLLFFIENDFTKANTYQLAQMYFMNALKDSFAKYIHSLKRQSSEVLNQFKLSAVRIAGELAVKKHEAQIDLLSVVANKLDDKDRVASSKVQIYLTQILERYIQMTPYVIDVLKQYINKPDITTQMIQTILAVFSKVSLSRVGHSVAEELLKLSIKFFNAVVDKKKFNKKTDSKVVENAVRSIKRCSLSSRDFSGILENIDGLYEAAKHLEFARMLDVFVVLSLVNKKSKSKRYLKLLYTKMNELPSLRSKKIYTFLEIVESSLNEFTSYDVVASFIRKMLILSLEMKPPVICKILAIVNNWINVYPPLKSMFTASNYFDEEENYKDLDDSEQKDDKVEKEEHKTSSSDDEEDETDNSDFINKKKKHAKPQNLYGANQKFDVCGYDMTQIFPEKTGAVTTKCFELTYLVNHYNPSVRRYAKLLVAGMPYTVGKYDWWSLTPAVMLSRFKLKTLTVHFKSEKIKNEVMLCSPVNSEEFLRFDRSKVLPELLFFFDYYTENHVEKGLAMPDKLNMDYSDDLEEDDETLYGGNVPHKAESQIEGQVVDFDVPQEKVEKDDSDEYSYEDLTFGGDLTGTIPDDEEDMDLIDVGELKEHSDDEEETKSSKRKRNQKDE